MTQTTSAKLLRSGTRPRLSECHASTTGAVESLARAREVVARSFPVERVEPKRDARWEQALHRLIERGS